MTDKKKIYIVTDPDGDIMVFDTKNAARKYVVQQAMKYNVLDEDYIEYVKDLMLNDPNSVPSSYNDFINKMLQSDDYADSCEYHIEDFVVKTEEDIDI